MDKSNNLKVKRLEPSKDQPQGLEKVHTGGYIGKNNKTFSSFSEEKKKQICSCAVSHKCVFFQTVEKRFRNIHTVYVIMTYYNWQIFGESRCDQNTM